MFDDTLENVLETPASPEPQSEPATPPNSPASPPEDTSAQQNLRMLRQKAERAERERDELMRRLQEIEAHHDTRAPQQAEDDDEVTLGPDELAEGKHLTKYGRKLKKLEKKLDQYQQQTAEMTVEARLKAQYPDFDKIVSADNIEMLRSNYPEIATTLNTSSDLYSKAVTAYTLIKKFGIQAEDPYKADRETAQKNAAKPRPLTSIAPQQGDSPLSHANAFANGLTDELRKQLHKEMVESMKSR